MPYNQIPLILARSDGQLAAATTSNEVKVGVEIPGHGNSFNYQSYIKAFYSFSISLGVSLTVLMIIYAGYKYLTSSGNQSAIGDAKDILLGALLGLAILLLIKFILNFIGLDSFGINGVPASN